MNWPKLAKNMGSKMKYGCKLWVCNFWSSNYNRI